MLQSRKLARSWSVAWLISCAFLALASCGHVEIRDSEWCADLGALGASCVHMLTDEKRRIEKDDWDAERLGQMCTKSESFSGWKAAIMKLCKQTRMCTYEDKRMLNAFIERVEEEQRQSQALRAQLQ